MEVTKRRIHFSNSILHVDFKKLRERRHREYWTHSPAISYYYSVFFYSDNATVPLFFVLLRNLPMNIFIVDTSSRVITPCTGQNISTTGASDVIAAQVGTGSSNSTFSSSLQKSPISLNFTFESTSDRIVDDSYRCVFWNFTDRWAIINTIIL